MAVSITSMLRAMHKARDDIERNIVQGLDADLERVFARAERKLYRQRKRFYEGLSTDGNDRLIGSVGNIEAASRAVKEVQKEITRLIDGPGQRWADKTVNVMAEAGRDLARINLNTDYLSQARIDAVFKHLSNTERRIIRVGKSDTYTIINTVGNDAGEFFRRTMLDSVADGIPVQGPGDTLTNRLYQSGRLRPVTVIAKNGRTITRSVRQRAQAIARVESAKILNAVQEAKVTEALGEEAVFRNSNPNDSRTTDICRFASREKPKTLAQWKASSYGKPPRLRPFHLCRSILIGGYAEWFDDEEAVEPVQDATPSKPIQKPKEVKGPQQLTEIDERIEAYGGQWKRRETVAKGDKYNRKLALIEKQLDRVEDLVPKRKRYGVDQPMDRADRIEWYQKVKEKREELNTSYRETMDDMRGWFFSKFSNTDELIDTANAIPDTVRPEWDDMLRPEDLPAVRRGYKSKDWKRWEERTNSALLWVQNMLQAGQEALPSRLSMQAIPAKGGGDKKFRAYYGDFQLEGRQGLDTKTRARQQYFKDTDIRGATVTDVKDDLTTMIHEIGHFLEFQVPGVREAAVRFVNYRTRGETATSLQTALPGFKYDAWEYGKKDDWEKTYKRILKRKSVEESGVKPSSDSLNNKNYAYYTGKTYNDGATEIISMGLESLYQDPVAFAKADPEFFDFMMGILDGELRYY